MAEPPIPVTAASVAPTSMFTWGFQNSPSEKAAQASDPLRRSLSSTLKLPGRASSQSRPVDSMTTRELLEWAKHRSMFRAEKELTPAGARTLHKVLVASHRARFDPDEVDPALVHVPMPLNASVRYSTAAGRTLKESVPAKVTPHPVLEALVPRL